MWLAWGCFGVVESVYEKRLHLMIAQQVLAGRHMYVAWPLCSGVGFDLCECVSHLRV